MNAQACYGSCDAGTFYLEEGPYDNFPGPFLVKVYLHIVIPPAPDDATAYDESLKDRADRIWPFLNEGFLPHNIFFTPGFGSCADPATTYQEIPDSYQTWNDIDELLDTYGHSDGIDLFIFSDQYEFDARSCPSGKWCTFQGIQNVTINSISTDLVASKTMAIVVHEIGHCLGLLHTFQSHNTTCEDEDGSDCWTKGDLVCDTPPDLGTDFSYNEDGDCSPSAPVTADYTNFMCAFRPGTCLDHFTSGQGERMRHYLGHGLGEDGNIQARVVISSNTTWSATQYPKGNIIVESGHALVINAPVYMPEGAYIYVERGASLTVYNTITGACNKMWQGIIVDGNDALSQTTTNQGLVYLSATAVIEHARCGVRLQGWYDPGIYEASRTGGMLRASTYATLRNNTIGVWFEKYHDPTASYLQGCKFTVTDGYRGNTSDKIIHLKIHGLYNLRVGGNFLDERTDEFESPTTRATGIDAYDAAFSIRPNFSSCHFESLYEGIHIIKVNEDAGSCHVEGAEFERCFTGIYSNNHSNFYFGGNSFYLFRPDNFTGEAPETLTGILLDGMNDGFMLTENDFSSTLDDNDDHPVGCAVVAISKANNRIFKNNFEYLYYGNHAAGANATETLINDEVVTYSGLWYECNENLLNILNTGQDFYVQGGGKIRYRQGQIALDQSKIAAGNIFTETLFGGTFDNLGSAIIYHYYDLDPDQEPDSPTGLTLIPANENTDCGDEECPPPCDTETELNTRKTQFFQTRQGWSDRLDVLPEISNPLKRQATADTVNFQRAMLDREGGLILSNYTLDTTGRKVDSILVWLGHMQTYESDLRLMLHDFFTRDFTGADAMITAIPATYELDEDMEADFADIQEVLETIRDIVDEEEPLESLPEDILDTLEVNWGTDCSQAGALARNLLHRNGRDLLPDCSEPARPALSVGGRLVQKRSSLQIYPNPANTEILIDCALPVDTIDLLLIYDLSDGRILWQQTSSASVPLQLDVRSFDPGVYVLTLLTTGGRSEHQKFVILR